MINSFYFIALTMIDQFISIGGGCLLLIGPANRHEWDLFTCGNFCQSNKQSCQSPDNDFGSLVEIKGQRNWEQAVSSKSATSCGLGSILLLKIVALQLIDLGEHCLSVPPALKHKKGFFVYNANIDKIDG